MERFSSRLSISFSSSSPSCAATNCMHSALNLIVLFFPFCAPFAIGHASLKRGFLLIFGRTARHFTKERKRERCKGPLSFIRPSLLCCKDILLESKRLRLCAIKVIVYENFQKRVNKNRKGEEEEFLRRSSLIPRCKLPEDEEEEENVQEFSLVFYSLSSPLLILGVIFVAGSHARAGKRKKEYHPMLKIQTRCKVTSL